jgi:flagellar hook-associated protein 3 FlgL
MRVTQSILYDTYVKNILRMQESLYETGKKLSTGKDVNTPSDDPLRTSDILSSRSLLSNLVQYQRNIDSTFLYLGTAEETLSSVKDVLSRLQEITVSMATGTADAGVRANAAIEVQGLFDQIVNLGNVQVDDKYVFSGYLTSTAAFDSSGAYGGDTNKFNVKVDANSTITIGVNGGEVFKGVGGGIDVFQAVTDLITALNADDTANIQAAVGTLDTSFSQISDAEADIGGKVFRINAANSNVSDIELRTRLYISDIEDVDIVEAISKLQIGQVALDAALASASKVFSVNIFNYI